eukprot:COSAG02_NODE_1129_length_14415_cov_828.291911_9_plen_150_part_00
MWCVASAIQPYALCVAKFFFKKHETKPTIPPTLSFILSKSYSFVSLSASAIIVHSLTLSLSHSLTLSLSSLSQPLSPFARITVIRFNGYNLSPLCLSICLCVSLVRALSRALFDCELELPPGKRPWAMPGVRWVRVASSVSMLNTTGRA